MARRRNHSIESERQVAYWDFLAGELLYRHALRSRRLRGQGRRYRYDQGLRGTHRHAEAAHRNWSSAFIRVVGVNSASGRLQGRIGPASMPRHRAKQADPERLHRKPEWRPA